MKAILLCGGIGKRMHPIIEDKLLLNFLGKSLLEHQIETLVKAGIKEFVIVCNPFNESMIKSCCKNLKQKIEFAVQKDPKGISDALLSAKKFLDGEALIVNPDDYCDVDAYEKIIKENKKNVDSIILGYKVSSYFPGGYVKVNEKNELIEIVEKPGEGNEPSDMVNIFFHYFKNSSSLIKYLKTTKSNDDDVYEKSISRMVKDGHKVKIVPYSGTWIAIKYPWNIFELTRLLLDKIKGKKISKTAKISSKATIEGNVVIGDNVRVFENATIRGPCYIGNNSVIGNNSLIWNYSHIGDNCVVGFSSEIKHSYIANNCWFHSNYIGDSIISNNCSFGAGTVTGNLRFDSGNIKVNVKGQEVDTKLDKLGAIIGEDSKTGINVSLMPGVKIGPNSIVGPHVTLKEDLEPNTIIFVKQEYLKKENTVKAFNKKEEFMRRLLNK